jgi:F1F0 ATPase subunit 2
MMTNSFLGIAVQAAGGLMVGFAVGVPHFALLRWNTRLFTTGSAGGAIALQLARMAMVVAILTLLARISLVTSLSGALGFLAARPLLLSRLGGLQ